MTFRLFCGILNIRSSGTSSTGSEAARYLELCWSSRADSSSGTLVAVTKFAEVLPASASTASNVEPLEATEAKEVAIFLRY